MRINDVNRKWFHALIKALTKASGINYVTQVIQHMDSGMNVVQACREVGMPGSSFYFSIENYPQAIADIQAIIGTNNRDQLVLIYQHKL